MKQVIDIGQVDYTVLVFVPDAASTDGSGKTGLTHADFTVSYVRVETDNDVVVTDVTSSLSTLTELTDAHTDWGVKEVSSTLSPGLYRLDIADAVFATGAWSAVVYVMITTSAAAASPMEFQLQIAAGASGGVSTLTQADIRTAVGLASADLDTQLDAIVADTNELQTDWANGGRLDLILDARASQTSVDDIPTNAELATALAAADDAVLSAVAALETHGDSTWATATGFSTFDHTSNQVIVATNNDKTGYALSATGSAAMTEGYAALGAAGTLPQLLYEMRALLAEKSISTTTLTTKKLDGSTTAATYTLDDATTPSSITRAT